MPALKMRFVSNNPESTLGERIKAVLPSVRNWISLLGQRDTVTADLLVLVEETAVEELSAEEPSSM